MAKSDIEIEVRIPVNRSAWVRIGRLIRNKAKFMGKSRDVDKYFNLPEKSFLNTKHPVEYLRVRSGDRGSFITYKYNHLDGQGKKTHADEFETGVADPIQMEKIWLALGYENFMTVDKKRESYRWGKFEIDLDEVSGLGCFVEIEAKGSGGMAGVVELAKKLSLDTTKQDNSGYVLLLMKKKGLVK